MTISSGASAMFGKKQGDSFYGTKTKLKDGK